MYQYWRRITIDNTKVGEDDANFAFLFSATLPDLATVANGGVIENVDSGGVSGALTVPADLVFASDIEGTSKYDFEIQSYDAATGEIIAWIESGVLSATDTVVYLVYSDKAVTSTQENVIGAWINTYKGVYHLQEAAGDALDSTEAVNDMSLFNTPTQGVAGKVGLAYSFNDADDEYLRINTALVGPPCTMQAWFKPDDVDSLDVITSVADQGAKDAIRMFVRPPVSLAYAQVQDGDNFKRASVAGTFSSGEWYFFTAVFTNATHRIVYNGVTPGAADVDNISAGGLDHSNIGVYDANGGTLTDPADGVIDEVRFYAGARTGNHVTTTYNNQNDPGTFYSVTGADRVRPTAVPSLPGLVVA